MYETSKFEELFKRSQRRVNVIVFVFLTWLDFTGFSNFFHQLPSHKASVNLEDVQNSVQTSDCATGR